MNESESLASKHLWNAMKTMLRGEFEAVNTFFEKEKRKIPKL